MLTSRESAPPSRYGDSSMWMYKLKQAIKQAIGLGPNSDLYNLDYWTVYDD